MLGKIQIAGMEFYAHHGCFEEERKVGTRFKVDVVFYCDVEKAAQKDDLSRTVNYQEVYLLVKEVMQESCNLLETLACKILRLLQKNYPVISKAAVTVYKMNPPLGGQTAFTSVTVEE